MALTNQQVQQVFLAITGRPAEGSAVAWGANSLSVAALANSVVDIRKGADFTNSKEAFVENLYTQLLGRPSDTEGKEFWLNALNNGASYGDVLAQFINAVLAQPSSADLYTLQNKLSIAEQISAQINTFQGGEANLKQIMDNVDANTTIEDLSNDLEEFKGQNVNVATVNVNTKADNETATEGSEENASVFNATVNILGGDISADENTLLLNGSRNYKDTLNLTLRASKESEDKEIVNIDNVLSDVNNVDILNLNVRDNNIEGVSGDISVVKSATFAGTSKDELSVTRNMDLLDTGAGDDRVTFTASTSIKALKLGSGNDTVILTSVLAGQSKTSYIDGGAGNNTLTLVSGGATNDFSKVSFDNIDIIKASGDLSTTKAAILNAASLDGANLSLDSTSTNKLGIQVTAANGINLSKIDYVEGGADATIAINGVKGGKVALTSNEIDIKETIALTNNAKGVSITNFKAAATKSADSLSITKQDGTASVSSVASASSFAKDTIFLTAVTKNLVKNGKVSADLASELSTATFKDGETGYIAQSVTGSNKTYIYKITGTVGGTTTRVDVNDKIELVATLDTNITAIDDII